MSKDTEPLTVKTSLWKCRKCERVSPAIGIQLELTCNYFNEELRGTFEEIPVRRYCYYCWVASLDEIVGQLDKVEE